MPWDVLPQICYPYGILGYGQSCDERSFICGSAYRYFLSFDRANPLACT